MNMMNERVAVHALLDAYESVLEKWRRAADVDMRFTGTVMVKDFYHCTSQLDDGVDSELYEILRAAYPTETTLTAAIDKVGGWFEKRVREMSEKEMWWSEFEELRVRVRAVNRSLGNYDETARKQQVLTVLIAHELSEATRRHRSQ